ncbi:NosD domain-containing protein [Methanogenium cariaci]|uniref:NosD domain-containing protein n=1 Tax=Methanogenium cariaci TaxID=2197 RepID=UPI0007858649|nr:NosD domain-containing protein [Methanogenium cariaci]
MRGGSLLVNTTITGNTIDDAWMGIGSIMGEDLAVTGNAVNCSIAGIYTDNMGNILVSDNIIRCNDTGIGIVIWADGADINSNIAENCSAQALMKLNDSVVYGNSFSGAVYPSIEGRDEGGDVFVYRNDFVLTDGILFGSILSTSAAAEDMPEAADIAADVFDRCLSIDDTLLDYPSPTGEFRGMSLKADTSVEEMQTGETNVTWHSPTEVTYWYYGRAFTQTMGNYWSTYTGTDTDHDASGTHPS